MSPRVNHGLSLWSISLLTLFETSRMAPGCAKVTVRLFCSSWNCHCSKHLATSNVLTLDLMDLVLWRTCRKRYCSINPWLLHVPRTSWYNTTQLHDPVGVCPEVHRAKRPKQSAKIVIVLARPYYSPDSADPNYAQYCWQSLVQYRSFRQIAELIAGYDMLKHMQHFYYPLEEVCNMPVSLQTLKLHVALWVFTPVLLRIKNRTLNLSCKNNVKIIHPKSTLLEEQWKSGCSYVSAVVTVNHT